MSLTEAIAAATSAHHAPLTVEQFHAMIQAGVLSEGAPMELIDGVLVHKDRSQLGANIRTVGPRHAHVIRKLQALLVQRLLGSNHDRQVQLPITLDETNAPEPDLAIVVRDEADYLDRHPGPGDVAAVIEAAESCRTFDAGRKCERYAAAAIPTDVRVDLQHDTVTLFTGLLRNESRYGQQCVLQRGDTMSVVIGEHTLQVPVSEFVPHPTTC